MQRKLFRLAIMAVAAGVFWGFGSGSGALREAGLTAPAMAQAAGGEIELMEGAPTTFMDYWRQGGPTMYALLALAIWATAVLIELLVKIRAKVFVPPDILRQLKDALSVGDYQKAWKIGAENPSPLSRVFCAAIEKLPKGREAVEEAATEAAASENSVYTIKNSYISLCAAIAPLLGLFGTISGMIGAFNAMAYGGAVGDPTRLAGDIGEALLTTYSGLLIAIPCMVVFYVIGNRLRKMMDTVQGRLVDLIEQVDFDNLPSDLVVATRDMKAAGASGKADTASVGARSAPQPKPAEASADDEVVACPSCNKKIKVGVKACPHCSVEMDWE